MQETQSERIPPGAALERILKEMQEVFSALRQKSEENEELPRERAWTNAQTLEHVCLVNHFLLLSAKKGVKICDKRASAHLRGNEAATVSLNEVRVIGIKGSFNWEAPAHMTPSEKPDQELNRVWLDVQQAEITTLLSRLRDGRGLLYRQGMSVAGLGKLDMYQWLYFIIQHARRHVRP